MHFFYKNMKLSLAENSKNNACLNSNFKNFEEIFGFPWLFQKFLTFSILKFCRTQRLIGLDLWNLKQHHCYHHMIKFAELQYKILTLQL